VAEVLRVVVGLIIARTMSSMRAFGADRMGELSVAARVNNKLFQQHVKDDVVRIGGHFRGDAGLTRVLATTDGGEIHVTLEDSCENKGLIDESESLSVTNTNGFVEVVGTKTGTAMMSLAGYIQFKNTVDVELWDGSVTAMHLVA